MVIGSINLEPSRRCKLSSKHELYCRNPHPEFDTVRIRTWVLSQFICNNDLWRECKESDKYCGPGMWVPRYHFHPHFRIYYIGWNHYLYARFETGQILGLGSSYDSSDLFSEQVYATLDNTISKLGIPTTRNFSVPSTRDWTVSQLDLFRDFITDLDTARMVISFFNALPMTNSHFGSDVRDLNGDTPWAFKGFKDRTNITFYHKVKDGIPILRLEARYRKFGKLNRALFELDPKSSHVGDNKFGVLLEDNRKKDHLFNYNMRRFGVPYEHGIKIFPSGNDSLKKRIYRLSKKRYPIHRKTTDSMRELLTKKFVHPATQSRRIQVSRLLKLFKSIGAYPACGVAGKLALDFKCFFVN